MKKKAPDNDQNAEQVERYYRNAKVDDPAVIRCTQGGLLEYRLTKISGINLKLGRIYVEKGDAWGGTAWHARSGKSCDHPSGQSNLVVPTEEVLAWIGENPRGVWCTETDYITTPPGRRDGGPTDLTLRPRASDIIKRRDR